MLLFLIFSLTFTKTYQYINAAYADAFMDKKLCSDAAELYLSEFKIDKNPLLASNYAISLFCLKQLDAAKYFINYAYINIDSVDCFKKKQAILYNYAHIYSYANFFSVSNNVLNGIDISILNEDIRANVYTLSCRNYSFLNKYKEAKEYCLKAYLIKPESCFTASVYSELFYKKGKFNEAINIFDKIFAKCKNEDISYYYSLSLYKILNKEKAVLVLKDFIDNDRNKALYDLIMKE